MLQLTTRFFDVHYAFDILFAKPKDSPELNQMKMALINYFLIR